MRGIPSCMPRRPTVIQSELTATLATLAEHGLKAFALDSLPGGVSGSICHHQAITARSPWTKNSRISYPIMTKVDLKGVAKVRAKGRVYYYAWRGGPRLKGEPGSPEFLASYHDAHQDRRQPSGDHFHTVVCAYRGSVEYLRLAPSTRRQWAPWLDRIAEYFGELRIRQFDRSDKIRPIIRQWRSRYASTPRTADFGLQVLSRLLSFAVDPLSKIERNPCEGIKQLYRGGNRSEIIWTEEDIAQLKGSCSREIASSVELAAHTGLRLGDLLRLSWSHIGADAIRIATNKSGGDRYAVVPLYAALQGVLAAIPKRSTTVLTNGKGAPWTVDGFGSSFNKAKLRAGLGDRDLHFHDLRGTAATRFYVAGINERSIAEMMGWEEDHVGRIIRRYVSRSAATEEIIRQLNRTERRTELAKPSTKPDRG